MIRINEITPTDDYTIIVRLDNGKSGVFDVKEYLNMGVFSELKDIEYFRLVRNHGRYISWPNEQDFCADSIAASLT